MPDTAPARLARDPLTFEVLRHRVFSIADEGSAVLNMVSSSPVAAEANDCNVAIMDRTGAAIAIGPGLSSHGIACMMTARYVQSGYADNPGIREGDMFLANDPFHCTPHQTCIALVTPVMWQGETVAWVGAGIHLPDVGGPVPGQVSVGAQSIYQEATPMLPLRIVEQGVIRKDLEEEFLIRSRTRHQVALDFRALIAACNRLSERLAEMLTAFGVEPVTTALEDIIQFVQAHLASRLNKIPDGRWDSTIWLDYPQEGRETEFYECALHLSKRGERLTLDFEKSSPQAPAVINCGEPGLLAAVLNAVMTLLGYGLPLCPEATLRAIDVKSKPGTFVHAEWPAGCSKATTAACHAIRQALSLGIGQMLHAGEELHTRAMAGSSGFLPVIELSGTDQHGQRFGVPLLDIGLTAGYGASAISDGIDSGGTLGSPFSSVANVETHEYRYPILYLWRRHEVDAGGLGQHRGGRGISMAFLPHRAEGPLDIVLHGLGCAVPSTAGLAGGQPGATNAFAVVRAGDADQQMGSGRVPQADDALVGQRSSVSGMYKSSLGPGDVLIGRNNGGGGFGDPLDRDPAAVLEDVRDGAASLDWARRGYGVVIEGGVVDQAATEHVRLELRQARLAPSRAAAGEGACGRCAANEVLTGPVPVKSLGRFILPDEDWPPVDAVVTVCRACGAQLDVQLHWKEEGA